LYLLYSHAVGTYMFDSDSMYIYNIVFNDQAIEAKFAEKWPQEIHAYPAVSPRSLTNQLAVLQQVLQSTADAKKPRKVSGCGKAFFICLKSLHV